VSDGSCLGGCVSLLVLGYKPSFRFFSHILTSVFPMYSPCGKVVAQTKPSACGVGFGENTVSPFSLGSHFPKLESMINTSCSVLNKTSPKLVEGAV
jgi:hypothetical protein